MTTTSLLLFGAALLGGALNAVAGGGSFIVLPALLAAGVPPVVANATSTLALWPGSLSSAFAYRREIGSVRSWLLPLGAVSLLGGAIGAVLLVRTSDELFLRILPWLMLSAALVFTFSDRVRDRTLAPSHPRPLAPQPRTPAWMLAVQLPVAVYGGYFGGGMGIIILAALAVARLGGIHAMNGVKAVLGLTINGVALLEFAATGTLAWRHGLLMAAGGMAGGFGGAALARTVAPPRVRLFVILVAWAMTAYFFLR